MTAPDATVADPNGKAAKASALSFATLTKRADFVAASRAQRQSTPSFTLQARKRQADEAADTDIRIGYTCSKKVGNAVARNRAKRRLREIARDKIPRFGQLGWDYVLVGRPLRTAGHPFGDMLSDLETALRRLHSNKG